MVKRSIHVIVFLLLITSPAFAQRWKDTLRFKRPTAGKQKVHLSDSTLNAIGIDSLLNKIENVHFTLNRINNASAAGFDTSNIEQDFPGMDSSVDIIHENLSLYNRVLDLKNLQLFDMMLTDIETELNQWRSALFKYNKVMAGMNEELNGFKKDNILQQLIADSAFRNLYSTELEGLKRKWSQAEQSTSADISRINHLQADLSNEYFEALELQSQVRALLRKTGLKFQSKEYPYLWETGSGTVQQNTENDSLVKKSYQGQRRILTYYFRRNWDDQLWMLLAGILFLFWVYRNFRQMEMYGTKENKTDFSPAYIQKIAILPTLVVIFNLAPFFNIHPPTAYVSITEFLLVIILTGLLRKRWPRQLFIYWLIIGTLYLVFSFTGTLLTPGLGFRILLLLVNLVSVIFGIFWIRVTGKYPLRFKGMIIFVSYTYLILNAAAVFCNAFGRLSLAKIFSVTAIFGLTQVIGLSVFIEIILEAFQLQTIVNRLKGGLAAKLSFEKIQRPLRRILAILSVGIWMIIFTLSLNIYNRLIYEADLFLNKPRKIGSTFFEIGNILLFIIILYVSHQLQKGIGSLYGKTSDNWDPEVRKNASRLAITRLALIVIGFLIAIAASGLPMDKITIVLGALGVGIGLGLQSIVNNFVSGIILIFEQPFRIGDYIELGDKKGRVLDIGIRSSKLMMEEGAEIIMPNADLLSGRVINWTLRNDNVRIELPLALATEHPFTEVSQIIMEALNKSEFVLKNAGSGVLLTTITDKSMNVNVRVWITNVHQIQYIKSILLNDIYDMLAQKGIGMI